MSFLWHFFSYFKTRFHHIFLKSDYILSVIWMSFECHFCVIWMSFLWHFFGYFNARFYHIFLKSDYMLCHFRVILVSFLCQALPMCVEETLFQCHFCVILMSFYLSFFLILLELSSFWWNEIDSLGVLIKDESIISVATSPIHLLRYEATLTSYCLLNLHNRRSIRPLPPIQTIIKVIQSWNRQRPPSLIQIQPTNSTWIQLNQSNSWS